MNYTPKDGFVYYYDFVKDAECLPLFASISTFDFLKTISEEKSRYRYEPEKWSIKQVIGHITDHERIKIHRAFLMSRKESVQLWGYDEKSLVASSRFDELTLQELVNDFVNVRKASVSFIQALSENQLKIKGFAKNYEVTLEDFLKSIIGHEIHHLNIIKERYV